MSALPPKADIRQCNRHVRFVPIADISGLSGFSATAIARLAMFVLAQHWSHAAAQVVYLPQKLLRLLHQEPCTRTEILRINDGFRRRLQRRRSAAQILHKQSYSWMPTSQ